jgi:hypothetical protein
MEWVILRQDTTKYCKFFAKCQTLADAIKDSTSGGTQNTTRAKGMTSTIVASHQRPLCILSLSRLSVSCSRQHAHMLTTSQPLPIGQQPQARHPSSSQSCHPTAWCRQSSLWLEPMTSCRQQPRVLRTGNCDWHVRTRCVTNRIYCHTI